MISELSNITFFIMGYKGYKVLDAFINKYGVKPISCVISERDINMENDYYKEIKELCFVNKVPFFNRKDTYELDSKYSFAISWKWILYGINNLIIFHDSILPKYRGFAPLVNALINGESEVGVTALFANDFYDRGNIISQRKQKVTYPIKINDAIDLITKSYVDLVMEISEKILRQENIVAYPQNESLATYSLWLDEDDYRIDWSKDSYYIKRFIDSVGFPYKGALTTIDDKSFRIYDSVIFEDVPIENRSPGKVIFIHNHCPVVVCGKGLLMITKMVDNDTKQDVLPFKRLRVRFK
ncbi:MAG: formyltransferase family protein [Thermoplasmata archaeon]